MSRHIIGILLGLCATGCAQEMNSLADGGKVRRLGGSVDGLPPIHQVINQGLPPSMAVASADVPDSETPALAGTRPPEPTTTPPAPPAMESIAQASPSSEPAAPASLGPPDTLPQVLPQVVEAPPAMPAPAEAPADPQVSEPPPVLTQAAPASEPLAEPPPIVEPLPQPAEPAAIAQAPAIVPQAAPLPTLPTTPAPASTGDPAVQPVGGAVQSTPLGPVDPSAKIAGLTVAVVGDETVSLRELQEAVKAWQKDNLPEGRRLERDELNTIASEILKHIIDRKLLVQEARRKFLDDEKKQNAFAEAIEKHWKENEIPRLVREYKVKNEWELRTAVEAQGQTLERMLAVFKEESLSQEFLREMMRPKLVRPELPALWAYYREHLAEFQRPAQVNWREILVRYDAAPDRATAQRQAEDLMARLRQGEDFASVAKAKSDGATATRGGAWETEPNASVSTAVNAALAALPVGQVSPILEGPQGFHIIAVEARRPAGPIPFVEAQDRILSILQNDLAREQSEAYLASLRSRSLVITRFEGNEANPARDPAAARTSSTDR